jgi:hypothetical protein
VSPAMRVSKSAIGPCAHPVGRVALGFVKARLTPLSKLALAVVQWTIAHGRGSNTLALPPQPLGGHNRISDER